MRLRTRTRRRPRSASTVTNSGGQSLVEFALVVPVFLLVLLGMIEFGRYVYQVQVVNEAAREGARYAIVHGSTALCPSGPMPGGTPNGCDPTGAKVVAAVRNYAVGIEPGSLSVTTTWSPNNGRGSLFNLVIDMTYAPLLPLIQLPPITVRGASNLVVQH